jgi:molybdate transport system substrate-binding protein
LRVVTGILVLLVTALLFSSSPVLAATKSAENFSHVFHDHYAKSPPLNVAVAANFAKPLAAIASDFTAITGIDVSIITSSSGTLYAQIFHGANFDVFLSADTARVAMLAKNNLIHPDNVAAYARGRLALITPNASSQTKIALERFIAETSGKFAIANPKLAPYGFAAQQVLQNTSLWNTFQDRLVKGKNVLQAYQYVSTGSVKGALVAYSTVLAESKITSGSHSEIESLESSSAPTTGIIFNKPAGSDKAGGSYRPTGLNQTMYWSLIDESLHTPIVQSLAVNNNNAAVLSPNIFEAIDDRGEIISAESLVHMTPASLFVQYLLSFSVQSSLSDWGYESVLSNQHTHALTTHHIVKMGADSWGM